MHRYPIVGDMAVVVALTLYMGGHPTLHFIVKLLKLMSRQECYFTNTAAVANAPCSGRLGHHPFHKLLHCNAGPAKCNSQLCLKWQYLKTHTYIHTTSNQIVPRLHGAVTLRLHCHCYNRKPWLNSAIPNPWRDKEKPRLTKEDTDEVARHWPPHKRPFHIQFFTRRPPKNHLDERSDSDSTYSSTVPVSRWHPRLCILKSFSGSLELVATGKTMAVRNKIRFNTLTQVCLGCFYSFFTQNMTQIQVEW